MVYYHHKLLTVNIFSRLRRQRDLFRLLRYRLASSVRKLNRIFSDMISPAPYRIQNIRVYWSKLTIFVMSEISRYWENSNWRNDFFAIRPWISLWPWTYHFPILGSHSKPKRIQCFVLWLFLKNSNFFQ